MVGPDFSVVGSDSAAELAGEVAPLEPQLHPLQLVPQRAHAPRIVTQHTQNLPALPLSIFGILPFGIGLALSFSTESAACPSGGPCAAHCHSESPCIAKEAFPQACLLAYTHILLLSILRRLTLGIALASFISILRTLLLIIAQSAYSPRFSLHCCPHTLKLAALPLRYL